MGFEQKIHDALYAKVKWHQYKSCHKIQNNPGHLQWKDLAKTENKSVICDYNQNSKNKRILRIRQ